MKTLIIFFKKIIGYIQIAFLHNYLFQNSFIYTAGDNSFGQSAINSSVQTSPIYQQVPSKSYNDKKPIKIVFGKYTNFLITEDYKLYAAGSNTKGRLGLDVEQKYFTEYTPVQYFIDKKIKIKDIAAGEADSLALDTEGNAYSIGQDYFYQNQSNIIISKIESTEQFIQVVAYDETHVLLSASGKLFFYGVPFDQWEDLCIGNECTELTEIPDITFSPVQLYIGQDALFITDSEGQLYVTGKKNVKSCLSNFNTSIRFNQIQKDFDVNKIVQGSSYSLILDFNGNVYGCGKNTYKQFGGNFTNTSSLYMQKINDIIPNVIDIAATNYGSILLQKDGEKQYLYVSGKQDYGELSLDSMSNKSQTVDWQQVELSDNNLDIIQNLVSGLRNSGMYGYQKQSNNLSGSAITGIVIGCVFGLLLLIIIIYFAYNCYKKSKTGIYANLEQDIEYNIKEQW